MVIDWDNTLCPTHKIPSKTDQISSEIKQTIATVEVQALALLRDSSALGEVVIITAASLRWIEKTRILMLKVSKFIDSARIAVISYRDPKVPVVDASIWKKKAFGDLLATWLACRQIVSIRDQVAERDAALQAGRTAGREVLVKTRRLIPESVRLSEIEALQKKQQQEREDLEFLRGAAAKKKNMSKKKLVPPQRGGHH
uniref:Uncharacterized protein n=1 Tax=Chromera velia CCMP2878 TaxID=1169474 RepID=A0A0G4H2K3_9ALVE|eukprot:Cvel_24433.t1-p1 / transcript=Cvel_24433.t1 / gene=Cvel_24433 / organism=Chromera_velia_CCMP2878 / gene_product=hypothetical protein / transcript_product=hypothetical protein / location=Cvel_scaffold2640:19755-21846(-) / protein_length=198 / sequence_SO=supercontig / SO=protein_coding / is_pseudo=false